MPRSNLKFCMFSVTNPFTSFVQCTSRGIRVRDQSGSPGVTHLLFEQTSAIVRHWPRTDFKQNRMTRAINSKLTPNLQQDGDRKLEDTPNCGCPWGCGPPDSCWFHRFVSFPFFSNLNCAQHSKNNHSNIWGPKGAPVEQGNIYLDGYLKKRCQPDVPCTNFVTILLAYREGEFWPKFMRNGCFLTRQFQQSYLS